jgi:predicted acylesterase/phospholipase RssA
MTIKHLVIAGGGPLGYTFLGALEHLNEEKYWLIENIESIYATSIGCIIGVFICLKYDWETLNKYVIERPWHDAFKLSGKQIFEAYYNKGLFDRTFMDIIFKPLLEAKDLSLSITLKEFYEYSKINLHIFSFEINEFKTIEISHFTHPDLELMQALSMTCALAGIFKPVIIDDNCYVDGGVMCNYPVNYCFNKYKNKDEILGINTNCTKNNDGVINEQSSVFEFIIGFASNAMKYISKSIEKENLTNEIICYTEVNIITLEYIQECMSNIEMRKKLLEEGKQNGIQFISQIEKNKETETEIETETE